MADTDDNDHGLTPGSTTHEIEAAVVARLTDLSRT
jgi:hypothetical protein